MVGRFIPHLALVLASDDVDSGLATRYYSGPKVCLGQESSELCFRLYCSAVGIITCRDTRKYLNYTEACSMETLNA